MDFFHSLPIPEFREWVFSIPFPFPNPQKSFPLTPEINRKVSRFLLILRLCNLATLTIMVIMIKVIWSDPAHRLTGALLVLVDMSATFLVNTC